MTLLPGDPICRSTSLGVGSMKDPIGKVAIDGIGALITHSGSNRENFLGDQGVLELQQAVSSENSSIRLR
jgi:hypothetical protein